MNRFVMFRAAQIREVSAVKLSGSSQTVQISSGKARSSPDPAA
jgi:hypothetical protein